MDYYKKIYSLLTEGSAMRMFRLKNSVERKKGRASTGLKSALAKAEKKDQRDDTSDRRANANAEADTVSPPCAPYAHQLLRNIKTTKKK